LGSIEFKRTNERAVKKKKREGEGGREREGEDGSSGG
jgi:hypothetical protein